MPSQHLEQIRVRATHPALYGLADKMRRVGKVMTGRHLLTGWEASDYEPMPMRQETASFENLELFLITGQFVMSDIGHPVVLPSGQTVTITQLRDRTTAKVHYDGPSPEYMSGTISICRWTHNANC